ncbi:MAG: Na+-transporting NADH:ubiquinone oxidoreductase subunit D, partial [Chitinivibrionales bacterium]|nr:Na+-transporting NADH:ubiquinone oxidoreductase subunit D [Chitinivibrionales bacterium]
MPVTEKAVEVPADTGLLTVSVSPHIRYAESVRSVMICVALALLPALVMSVYVFGMRALSVTVVAVAAALAAEYLTNLMMQRKATIGDISAVVTGMLVAYNVPHTIPLWMPAVGSAFAIGVAKMAFGGLGHNFVNPALAGRAFLMACYPTEMTVFGAPKHGSISGIDGVTAATPLRYIKDAMADGSFQGLELQEALPHLFWGNVGGCIGETSAAALLLGAAFLW